MAQKKTRPKTTRVVSLNYLPLDPEEFGPEEAREWIRGWLHSYTSIVQTAEGRDKNGEMGVGMGIYHLLDDVRHMVETCFDVIESGKPVRLQRDRQDRDDKVFGLASLLGALHHPDLCGGGIDNEARYQLGQVLVAEIDQAGEYLRDAARSH